jgi:hypothetical protein
MLWFPSTGIKSMSHHTWQDTHFFFFFLVCLHGFLCTTYVSGTQEGQKRASAFLGLEFQMVVSRSMGAGNLTSFLWKS